MAKDTKKHPGGRPKKIIDYKLVEKLAGIFCTQSEIAAALDVSLALLDHDKEFIRIHKRGRQNAKRSLRRKLWSQAGKNAAMGIWLSKNELGYHEPRTQIDLTTKKSATDLTHAELMAMIEERKLADGK